MLKLKKLQFIYVKGRPMRVISGVARGLKLKDPKNAKVRPTTEKVKEAVFDVLQFDIKGKVFLDLFAGTGQIGIEALSRGAEHVYFVDYRKESLDTIKFNLGRIGKTFGCNFSVVNMDVSLFLKTNNEVFDVVYLDPPYGNDDISEVLACVSDVAAMDGIVIFEHAKESILPNSIKMLQIFKSKSYGSIAVSFYRKV